MVLGDLNHLQLLLVSLVVYIDHRYWEHQNLLMLSDDHGVIREDMDFTSQLQSTDQELYSVTSRFNLCGEKR